MSYVKALTIVKWRITRRLMARETNLPHLVQLRIPEPLFKGVDAYRRHQPDIPTRSEAIRRLVALGIGAEPILRDILRLMEHLPADAELNSHAVSIRGLVEPVTRPEAVRRLPGEALG